MPYGETLGRPASLGVVRVVGCAKRKSHEVMHARIQKAGEGTATVIAETIAHLARYAHSANNGHITYDRLRITYEPLGTDLASDEDGAAAITLMTLDLTPDSATAPLSFPIEPNTGTP